MMSLKEPVWIINVHHMQQKRLLLVKEDSGNLFPIINPNWNSPREMKPLVKQD
jgi:hypothetical protein